MLGSLNREGPGDPAGGRAASTGLSAAEFYYKHIRDNPSLSAVSRDFMFRLLLDMKQLPWPVSQQVEYVFEDVRGEVQVCFAPDEDASPRHLHFSEVRESFIRRHIAERDFPADAEYVLCEWVRSISGRFEESHCLSIEFKRRDEGTFSFIISSGSAELVDGETVEGSGPRPLVLTPGVYMATQADLAERALAEGARVVLLSFATSDDLAASYRWLKALDKRYEDADILTESADDEPCGVLVDRNHLFPISGRIKLGSRRAM